ncbi:methionyl-tRNA formyltransferase [bacterium]|nr:methionyl-tRNA formyltransferase [bacterium]
MNVDGESLRPRLVVMGTPDFGVPAFRCLHAQGFPIAGVVTAPDRPRGRGQKEAVSAVKQMAAELNLKIFQPEKVNDEAFLQQLRELDADILVVAAYGQILKRALLTLTRLGCVNLHASLLPKYRGAAPIQWAIANGESKTGVTVQMMAEQVDAGDVIVLKSTVIGPDETAPQLYQRLSQMGCAVMVEALEKLAVQGPGCGIPQDASQATSAPRLGRDDGLIDWKKTAQEIHNHVRAFNPWPGTFTHIEKEHLKITATRLGEVEVSAETVPGSVLEVDDKNGWLVAAGSQTALRVMTVQCANSKQMSAQSYTCGHQTGIGSILGGSLQD